VDFSKLSREDWMVGGGGILLIIFLFTLPFYSSYGFTFAATSSPASIWGILALILTLVVVADWALALFSPETQLPTSPLGRELTRASLAAVVVLFLVIKLLLHTGYLGWGCFVDIIVAVVVVYGTWMIAQGKSTPVKA
jgi:cobalamin synthase